MEKENLLEYVKCPLTKLIFCDPCMAEDGNIYENMAIKNWFWTNTKSPITGEKMGTTLIRANATKKFVVNFLEKNPEFKNDQFLFKKPFYLFEKEFIDMLKKRDFSKMKEFTTFVLNFEIDKETLIESLSKANPPNDILTHIIDNSIDYDIYDRKGLKPIHVLCKYSNSEIISHLIKKNIDLESEDPTGNRVLGYVIMFQNDTSIIANLLKLGVNINYENNLGYRPIHHIIIKGDLGLLKFFKNYDIDMTSISQKLNGLNPLQCSFRMGSKIDVSKYLIDQDLNIGVDPDPKITCEQLIYQNVNFTKRDKQQLVLYYLNKYLSKPIIVDDFIDNIDNIVIL